ncbi:energy transducer TonB [uncultured Umboniibacter sp.]|uniref:energy transducer TonB n=1 Tax=uncultured Umboniibacter sp. TaxID=1798917 RepID=UPI002628302B|nr:energy transducer TonB [uncultured Umboniibacter sp.]
MIRLTFILTIALFFAFSPINSDALDREQPAPVVRILPQYPANGLGREGEVELAFTINEEGRAVDIKVVAADPEGVFEQAAMDALKQWLYRPIELAGKPIAVTGVHERFRFLPPTT